MIPSHKLDKLTEDELDVLLYCVNEHKSTESEINMEEIKWLRIPWIYNILNEMATKIKPENVTMLQQIMDKLNT